MCNFKNHYRPKKWYGHGRTADDGPAIPIPIVYLVFISIIFQPNLILVTSTIAPVTRKSTSLVNKWQKLLITFQYCLTVGMYMGISLVKFVSHIFWIHYQHSHKPTSFHTKKYTKTASLSNGILLTDPSVPSVLWFFPLVGYMYT